ncbi:MAG: hypothetical protein NTV51_26115 [Verrucomicrobia bacterium]|nr:hypothetical protein [Verrucomicrobiota bacterium]
MFTTTQLAFADETTARSSEEALPFHIVIAHDDHEAYVRALRMLNNTFRDRPEADDLRPLPWKFDDLQSEPLRKRALADAPRADVFVVSASHFTELPETVVRWLTDCFARRQNQPTAVIALCASLNDIEAPWRRSLRETVARAGFDFLEANSPVLQGAA